MPRAKLRVTVPDSVWIGEISRNHADAEIEVLTTFPKEDTGVALAEITGPDVATVVREIDAAEAVTATELLQHKDETALVQFETSEPVLLVPARNVGTPIEFPFSVVDGTANWEVIAPRDRLSMLAEQLRRFDIDFDVVSVRQEVETEQLLTSKQRDLVSTAVEEGYYDTPRDCTLTELAAVSDIAKSTCSETLHRAEEKVIKEFVAELGPVDGRAAGVADGPT